MIIFLPVYILTIIYARRVAYKRSLVPYILAENLKIKYSRAIQLSNRMTKGYLSKLFAIDLYFIFWILLCIVPLSIGYSYLKPYIAATKTAANFGWLLLCLLPCCVGCVFLMPYIAATKAEAYALIKANAKLKGITDDNELPGFSEITTTITTTASQTE